jgi:hypothetical protein
MNIITILVCTVCYSVQTFNSRMLTFESLKITAGHEPGKDSKRHGQTPVTLERMANN